MSGSGCVLRASTSTLSASTDGSPRRDFAGRPTTPTTSPRWTSSSPVTATSQITWMRPERSTRSRKTSLPIPAPRHRPAGDPARLADLAAVLERLGLGADGRDLVPVGKALRCRRLGHARIVRPRWTSVRHRRPFWALRLASRGGARGAGPEGIVRQHRPGRHGAASAVSCRGGRLRRRERQRPRRQAALISMILNLTTEPRGVVTSTVSPFLRPMIALPTGDSFESLLLGRVRLGGADDVVLDRLLRVDVAQPDDRADRDDARVDVGGVDHARVRAAAPRAARSCARASPARSSRRRTRRSRRCPRTRARSGSARRSPAAGRCAGRRAPA